MRHTPFALALLLSLSVPAFAQNADTVATSAVATSTNPADVAEIKKVEDYLNSLSTLKARFVQTAPNGNQLAGDFLLKRPGRLRFQYDKPVEDFIVADGRFIYYYDSELKEQKNMLISRSLANFFLREDLKLSGDVAVTDMKREDGLLIVTVVQGKDRMAGSLTMGFTENPMELKKWRVVDAQGLVTETELFDTVTGIKIDNETFRYYDPKRKDRKFN